MGVLHGSHVNRQEIQLTQDLIELFVRYQVPPDLMSYDGEPGSGESTAEKLKQARDARYGYGASNGWERERCCFFGGVQGFDMMYRYT